MSTIIELIKKHSSTLDVHELEIIIAHGIKKSREFVMAHPEHELTSHQSSLIGKLVARRKKSEPIAYIIGHKEFYGLDFIVNKHTLIPRPETEQIVEEAMREACNTEQRAKNIFIIDVGTGSGNIITSVAKVLEKFQNPNFKFIGIDISKEALKVAKKNARVNTIDRKIKFIHGSLLTPLLKSKKLMPEKLIITANLPYLSKDIYQSAPTDVKNYEPKSALYSAEEGLQHYRKLLQQIKQLPTSCSLCHVSCFLEISPEQKKLLPELIKKIVPKAKIEFQKDLAGKWRICKINLK